MLTKLGMVTFGNIEFTKLAIRSILETSKRIGIRDIILVVGKPGDTQTVDFANQSGIPYITHTRNYGFPYSLNDIYDFCWKDSITDNIIIMGNDVIAYPFAIDSLIKVEEMGKYEWICSKEVSAKSLVKAFPSAARYFQGPEMRFSAFNERPWEVFDRYSENIILDEAGLSDVHNLALFNRSVFDKIGYIDVNFYPAYYSDNDYARRAVHAKINSCTLSNSLYFHFWSRTIHQGHGGSTNKHFGRNADFYKKKWGGGFGSEAWTLPFNGEPIKLAGVTLEPSIKIDSRDGDVPLTEYWRNM